MIKKAFFSFLSGLICLLGFSCSDHEYQKLIKAKEFQGEISGYKVKIQVPKHGQEKTIIVTLLANVNANTECQNIIAGKTKFMNLGGNWVWDELSIESCSKNKEEIKSFSKKETKFAKKKLNEAMKNFYPNKT